MAGLVYEGDPVAAVIARAKERRIPLLVSIHHGNQAEVEYLHEEQVTAVLQQASVMAIKLEVGSSDCNSFAEFLPIVRIPCAFLIAPEGTPLLSVQTKQPSAQAFAETLQSALGIKTSSNEDASGSAAHSSTVTAPVEKPAKEPLSKEDIIRRIEKKRLDKAEQEKLDARSKEVERRKVAKAMAEAKRSREDIEIQKIAEERKRIKKEDRLAKERILKQIEDDKRERVRREEDRKRARDARNSVDSAEAQPVRRTATADSSSGVAASQATTARIRFRLPGGDTHMNIFQATATVQEVRRYVDDQKLVQGAFVLVMTLPTRSLEAKDDASTLRDLRLAPSGALLVTQQRGSPHKLAGQATGALGSLPALLWGYVTALVAFLTSINPFGGQPNSQPPAAGGGAARGAAAARRPQGRLGRLNDLDPDEDKRATYNGNSTTQE